MADRVEALQADVVWRANTGQAEVDIERLRRQFHETTGDISTAALRASAAQDKLDRALARHGPASTQAKTAEIQLRQELERTTSAANRQTAALIRDHRSVERFGRGALVGSGALRGLARTAAFASTSFLGAAGLSYALRTSVDAASNLNEQTSKAQQVFGASAAAIVNWGKTTAASIGIANDKALEAAGTFGNLFTTVGLAPAKNAELSRSLVQLAADLASFNNTSPEDALDALRSGLIGEAEPLRRFGVLLSEARVKQEAMRETGKRNAAGLTDQEKLLARYSLILRDTAKAQGDFARTADGQANAQRTLKAEIRDTEAVIGKALLPTVRDLTKALRDWLARPENQKKIQEDTEKTVGFFGKLFHETGKVAGGFKSIYHPIDEAGKASRRLNSQIEQFLVNFTRVQAAAKTGEDIRLRAFGAFAPITGEDVRLRGAGALGTELPPAPGRRRRRGPHDFGVPQRFLIAEARAGTLGAGAQLDAAQAELAYVKSEIASGKLTRRSLADAYNEQARLQAEIDQLQADADRKATEASRRRAERAKDRERRQHDRIRAELALDERKRQNQLQKALLTKTLADDKQAQRELIEFYRREAHDRRLTEKEREDFLAKQLRAEKAARAKKTAGVGTAVDLYAQAAENERIYGTNIMPRGGILSPQDARGELGVLILAELRRANMQRAEANRHAKATAHSTEKIHRSRTAPGDVAAALSSAGAW